jgi:uncharacterized protein YceK
MMHSRQIRGLAVAGMLTVAVAGCGTEVAGAASGTGTAGTTTSATSTATGCSGVNLATKVTVIRAMHLVEPTRVSALTDTQTNAAEVRTLFRDFCAVVTHPDNSKTPLFCPNDIGLAYGGTFYDGSRTLATYTYAVSGCQVVTVNSPGKKQSAVVRGTAAAAAPNLENDLAKVLGVPKTAVMQPYGTSVNQGGGMDK